MPSRFSVHPTTDVIHGPDPLGQFPFVGYGMVNETFEGGFTVYIPEIHNHPSQQPILLTREEAVDVAVELCAEVFGERKETI